MPRKSKYQLELEERRRNPGGYIGEAMDAAKPKRKPRPFTVEGEVVAKCYESISGHRWMYMEHTLDGRHMRRYARWLSDAADWVEEGK